MYTARHTRSYTHEHKCATSSLFIDNVVNTGTLSCVYLIKRYTYFRVQLLLGTPICFDASAEIS